jgi:hypothetical protein
MVLKTSSDQVPARRGCVPIGAEVFINGPALIIPTRINQLLLAYQHDIYSSCHSPFSMREMNG